MIRPISYCKVEFTVQSPCKAPNYPISRLTNETKEKAESAIGKV